MEYLQWEIFRDKTLYVMKAHIFKTSKTKQLLIADSQAKRLVFTNFNILSISGGRIFHVQNHLPTKGQYEIICLFIGGNDIFNGTQPSARDPEDIGKELAKLAKQLSHLCERVYVLGIPPRVDKLTNDITDRHFEVDKVNQREAIGDTWVYRSIKRKIYCEADIASDDVHITQESLRGLRTILKNNVLRSNWSLEISRDKRPEVFHCSQWCNCGTYKPL